MPFDVEYVSNIKATPHTHFAAAVINHVLWVKPRVIRTRTRIHHGLANDTRTRTKHMRILVRVLVLVLVATTVPFDHFNGYG
eukprot:scaffold14160_cov26-Prasinocladus_malaysianus.AAC.1